jgi:hypothetical protein
MTGTAGSGWVAWAWHCLPVSAVVGVLGGVLAGRWGWSEAWWGGATVAFFGAFFGAVPVVRLRKRQRLPEQSVALLGWSMGLRTLTAVVGALGLVLGGLDRFAVGVGVAVNYLVLLVAETRWTLGMVAGRF